MKPSRDLSSISILVHLRTLPLGFLLSFPIEPGFLNILCESYRYIGNAAVFDLGKLSFMGGLAAMYAWRSVYWSEQVSSRTRALLMIDWIVRQVWFRFRGFQRYWY